MEKTVLISLPVEDLQTLIIDCVNSCLKYHRLDKKVSQDNSPDLLTITQVSELLHLSVPTLYTKVHHREIPFIKKGGRLYFSRNELMGWLREGRRATRKEIDQQAADHVHLINKR